VEEREKMGRGGEGEEPPLFCKFVDPPRSPMVIVANAHMCLSIYGDKATY